MNFPRALSQVFQKKHQRSPYFLTLVLDQDAVQAAIWTKGSKGEAVLAAAVAQQLAHDTWEERCLACSRVISALKQKANTPDIRNVIFGLPGTFLTADGDIPQDVRSHLKTICRELSLTPLGFVSMHQAIIYKLKRVEGVPPTVILLGINRASVSVFLYKVGSAVAQETVSQDENVVEKIEKALKSFTNAEVLPSRILLFGLNQTNLEELKTKLMRHPWTNRANFLHFPKIEILPTDTNVATVSMAGVGEMTSDVAGEDEIQGEAILKDDEENDAMVESPESNDEDDVPVKNKPSEDELETEYEAQAVATEEGSVKVSEQLSYTSEKHTGDEEHENIILVEPESLGFRSHTTIATANNSNIHEDKQFGKDNTHKDVDDEADIEESEHDDDTNGSEENTGTPSGISRVLEKLPAFRIRALSGGGLKRVGIALGVIIILIVIAWGTLVLMPKATVTLVVSPKTITKEVSVIIDSQKQSTNSAVLNATIHETNVNGEKTIQVTGKKKVGEQAKGTLSIYNKSLTTRNFKKGATLSARGIQFSLDSDVQVASASESIGSITFGKVQANVTAASIGVQGNVPAATEFIFKDVSSSIAIGRNDGAFTGGTSRDVTVVSRVDMDNLVKTLSEELSKSAKESLASQLGAGATLIEPTVKSSVSEKQFQQELDEESTSLTGSIVVKVTGFAYAASDLLELGNETIQKEIPQGYELASSSTRATVKDIAVKKDGSALGTVLIEGTAVPIIESDKITNDISGKKISEVEEYLKTLTGISEAHFAFSMSIFRDRLPRQASNIKIVTDTGN